MNTTDPEARPWAAGRHAPRKTRAAATHALGAAALLLSFLGGVQGAQLPPGLSGVHLLCNASPDLRILPSRPQLSCTPAHLPTCAPAGEHGRQLPKLGMILAGVGMASATPSSVHEGPAVSSSSMPPLESTLKSRPAWDSRTRRILNSDCRTNLKLVNLDKWCYQLPLATCNRYYYVVATTGRLKVPYALTILHNHTHFHNEHTRK